MMYRTFGIPMLLAAGTCAAQGVAPEPGRDYVSVQLAAGDARALSALYERHAALPYLRIEKRGATHVLRAGFWQSEQQAKDAIAGSKLDHPLIRSAAFRPEAIVQDNWQGTAAARKPALTATAESITPPAATIPALPNFAMGDMPAPRDPGSMMPVAMRMEVAADRIASPAPTADTRAPVTLALLQTTQLAAAPLDAPAAREATPAAANAPAMGTAPPGERGSNAPVTLTPAALRKSQSVLDEREELRPFNQDDYVLAFDIFAGAGDLRRAFKVAERAVASVPDDAEWRLKLARVAEWTQRPQVAWAQREYLFRRGDRSNETLTALLRLSSVAPNLQTVLAVWEYKASRGPITRAQWNDIANLFDAASQPREGSRFFEAQYRRLKDVDLLARAAQLAENGADDERAYQLYTERLALKPFSVDLALRAVVFLLRKDRNREAFALMEAHRDEVPPEAVEFWRILAQTSWELAELGSAERAYRNFLANNKTATAADWSRLIALVRQRHPEEAADLAMQVYRRYNNLDYLILALTIRTDANDTAAQARVFASLSDAERTRAEEDNRFMVLRAQYFQRIGAEDRAWNDYRRALGRSARASANNDSPDAVLDTEVTVPALWFLIDTRRKNELVALLNRLGPQAKEDSAYWMAYAAAYHALDRYREAIVWYRKEIDRKPDDALLMLNYADALDRYQLAGMADRVRQHVWVKLRDQSPGNYPKVPMDSEPELLAFTRLALLNRPGDPALALVREVSAQLRGLPASAANVRETRTLLLSWAVSTEQFRNARQWMWLQYASSAAARVATAQENFDPRNADTRGAPPLWAEIQTALQLNDTQTMDRLLEKQADGLPIYNRYDTAYATERWHQALDLAFRGMEQNNVDEELHDRFRIHAPLHTNYLQAGFSTNTYGDLKSNNMQLEGRFMLFRKLHLKVGFARANQSSDNPDFGPLVPSTDKLMSLEARYLRNDETETTLAVFRRNEAATQTGWRLTQTLKLTGRLTVDGAIEQKAAATDSIALRVAGYADSMRFGVTYNIGKREYVRLSPQVSRYYTQYDDYLGHSSRIDFEAGYRIRTEYPDLRARVFVNRQLMTRDGSISAETFARLPSSVRDAIAGGGLDALRYFLPDGSTTSGVCLGGGENLAGSNLQEVYTRAWRPFFEACRQHNSINGAGYIGLIGVAGSVIGPDHLSLRLETSRGGTGAGALARTLALRYRYYF